MKKYVIIGGGVASVGCIEGIRSRDTDCEITLITAEGCPVYCRPLISYYLEGKTDLEKMKYRPDSFYAENGCELVAGTVASVDTASKKVTLTDGRALGYDELCVATGSSPFVPPFEGLDGVEKRFSFMTEADALALEAALEPSARVLIVGAGLIGLKCAEGICERVASVTVCDLAPRVLSSILDDECAPMMQRVLEEHGVRFMLGDSVERFECGAAGGEASPADVSGYTAVMKGGDKVEFDVLVLAVGVRANTALVKDAGGEVDRGIITDLRMRSSLEGVYAAGDCAQGYDASIGENRVLAILPNAYMQGRCAGVNMAGGDEVYDSAIPMNAIGFFGYHALTAGSYDGELYETRGEGTLRRLFVRDGRLVGFMLLGDVERAGIYTAMIRQKTPLGEVDFGVLKEKSALIAFSADARRTKLGGEV